MTYCFDIDGTLCTDSNGNYPLAEPIFARIQKARKLYSEGHTIVIFTARGASGGGKWEALTEK